MENCGAPAPVYNNLNVALIKQNIHSLIYIRLIIVLE